MTIAIAPLFRDTPVFDVLLAEYDGVIPEVAEIPEPGMIDPEKLVWSLVGTYPVFPEVDELETAADLSVARIEADYDELYPSEAGLSAELRAWLADRSEERPLAIAPVVDVPDSFYEPSEDGHLVPAERTVIIVPVAEDFSDGGDKTDDE